MDCEKKQSSANCIFNLTTDELRSFFSDSIPDNDDVSRTSKNSIPAVVPPSLDPQKLYSSIDGANGLAKRLNTSTMFGIVGDKKDLRMR